MKIQRANSTAYATNLVVKASPGTLLSLTGYNSGGAVWIQLHDATALPADTAVPVLTQKVAATASFNLLLPIGGIPFKKGIVAANSGSTVDTLATGSAIIYFTATFTN